MSGLDLRVGFGCDQSCRFCDQAEVRARLTGTPELWTPIPALMALLDGQPRGPAPLWLAGGEVLLRPDLPRLLRTLREAGFRRIGLQTSGKILAAPGAAMALRQAGLSDVAVALHGDEGVHDWITGVPGSYRLSRAGARAARQAGLALRIHTVLTRSLLPGLTAFVASSLQLLPVAHRFSLIREEGAAVLHHRAIVPRLALLAEPLVAAIEALRIAGVEAETRGVPLCVLGAARWAAADGEAPLRLGHAGVGVVPDPQEAAPPCAVCDLAARCPKVPASYLRRFGSDELLPAGAPRREGLPRSVAPVPALTGESAEIQAPRSPPPGRAGRPPATRLLWARRARGEDPVPPAWAPPIGNTLKIEVEAPCSRSCTGCPAPGWTAETTRRIRQRLVRAAGEGPGQLVFAGGSPWEHPALPEMVREAVRLGFERVEVWGPVHPLAELGAPAARKLDGIAAIRWPRLTDAQTGVPGHVDTTARALSRLAELLPGVPVSAYTPGEAPRVEGWGPQRTGCEV